MQKAKEKAAAPVQAAPETLQEQEQKPPEREPGRLQRARSRAASSSLPPPDGGPSLARPGSMMGDQISVFGTSNKAGMANTLQRQAGNLRLGSMASLGISTPTASRSIQRSLRSSNELPAVQPTRKLDRKVSIQQKCACGGEAGPDGECATCKAKRMAIQRQANTPETPPKLPASVTTALQSRGGQPLDRITRSKMEDSFDADFSGVRVHTNSQADLAARDINANAFTSGQDIYFGTGLYQPGTQAGDKLLAHELTHTIQQGTERGAPQTAHTISQPGEPEEQEADAVSERVSTNGAVSRPTHSPSSVETLQRQPSASTTAQNQGATLPATEAADSSATLIIQAVRNNDIGGAVRPLRGKSVDELASIRTLVNEQLEPPLERWFVARMNRANAIQMGMNALGAIGAAISPGLGVLGTAATLGQRLVGVPGDGTAEEGLRLLWPALGLLDRLEVYDEGFRELEQAQLDVIRSASNEQREAARRETDRLSVVLAHMDPKEEYDARVLLNPTPDGLYRAAVQLLNRASGFFSDLEDPVFDAILALEPAQRRRFFSEQLYALYHLLDTWQLVIVRRLAEGSEAQALIARLRLATESRIDDQAAVEAMVSRAVALLRERRELRVALEAPNLPAAERTTIQERLRELDDLDVLLQFRRNTSGELSERSFMGMLSGAHGSAEAFGADTQRLAEFAPDQRQYAFETAKQRILLAAGDPETIQAVLYSLHAPPVPITAGATPGATRSVQHIADLQLRQDLLRDREVAAIIGRMTGFNASLVQDAAQGDLFSEVHFNLNTARRAGRWGEFFQLVVTIARNDEWRRQFEATSGDPFGVYASIHGREREIMLTILRERRLPLAAILQYTSNVDELRVAFANISEGERERLRLGWSLARERPVGSLTQEQNQALRAFQELETEVRRSQTMVTLDAGGFEAVLGTILGSEPTATELASGKGRYRAAALMFERQEARLRLNRGSSAHFTETDETMDAAAREFAALWLRVRDDHTLSMVDFAALSAFHQRFLSRAEEFTQASNTISEMAGMVAATVAGVVVVAATGGMALPGVIAMAAAAGAGTRVITSEMFGEEYHNVNAREALLGAIDGALAVVSGRLAARGAELLGMGSHTLTSGAARIAGEVAVEATRPLSSRVAAGAVEGALDGLLSGSISEAFGTLTDERTWRRGVMDGLVRVGQAAIMGGLVGLGTGGLAGGVLPVAGSAGRRLWDAVVGRSLENTLARAGASEALAAARAAARRGEATEANRLATQLETHLNPEEALALHDQLLVELRETLRHPPGRADIASLEQAHLLAQSSGLEGDSLSVAQRNAELDIVRRSEPQPSSLDGYVDEVDLGNGDTWRRRADGTWCRFSVPSLCGTELPGAAPMHTARVGDRPPPHYEVIPMDYTRLPRDTVGNVEPLPHGVVYEFPGGNRVWREGRVIRHESVLGTAPGRQDFELEMFLASETGRPELRGMERAHTLGQGTGFESPFGIYYAPREVNQIIQNNGIEEFLRGLRDNAATGETFHVATLSTPHPDSVRLQEIRYRVEISRNGRRDFMFEYVINVGNDVPNPTVTHEVANITQSSEIAHYFDLVDVPERLRERFARFRNSGGG